MQQIKENKEWERETKQNNIQYLSLFPLLSTEAETLTERTLSLPFWRTGLHDVRGSSVVHKEEEHYKYLFIVSKIYYKCTSEDF